MENHVAKRMNLPLRRYRLEFQGRTIGALGVNSNVSLVVEAYGPDEAKWKAYDTHEHIWKGIDGVRVTEIP